MESAFLCKSKVHYLQVLTNFPIQLPKIVIQCSLFLSLDRQVNAFLVNLLASHTMVITVQNSLQCML